MADQIQKGRPVSPAEIEQMVELQKIFKPEAGMKRLEDFAKWLFGSTTIIATLGTGFSWITIANLNNTGKFFFGLALILVGISLALAALSLAPFWVTINPNSRDSMNDAVEKQFSYRRARIKSASVCFATGLVFAAFAPLSPAFISYLGIYNPNTMITYNLDADGKFAANYTASGLRPRSYVEVELQAENPHTKMIMPKRRAVVDLYGNVSVDLVLPGADKISGLLIILAKYSNMSTPERLEVPIKKIVKH